MPRNSTIILTHSVDVAAPEILVELSVSPPLGQDGDGPLRSLLLVPNLCRILEDFLARNLMIPLEKDQGSRIMKTRLGTIQCTMG